MFIDNLNFAPNLYLNFVAKTDCQHTGRDSRILNILDKPGTIYYK